MSPRQIENRSYHFPCCQCKHDLPSEVDMTSCLAMSNQCLLMIKFDSNGLVLFDLSTNPFKRRNIFWSKHASGQIRDLAWVSALDCFLLLTEEHLYSYSPQSNSFEILHQCSSILNDPWSMTVLNSNVYLLSRSDTLQCYSLPSWTPTKSWSRHALIEVERTDQYIEQIRSHPSIDRIALLIRLRHHRQWRIDFYDRMMMKLFSTETLRFASAYPTVRLHPFGQNGQWTLFNENFIWLISDQGQYLHRHYRKSLEENDE